MEKKHQTTYYRTVPMSEKPKEEGWYDFLGNDVAKAMSLYWQDGQWRDYEGQIEASYEPIDNTHYLQPIPLPDAERLREKMQEIAEATEGWKDGIGSVVNRIAREALSAVGDGWVELREGCEMPDYDELVLWHPIDGNQFTAMLDKDGNDWLAHCTHWKRLGNNPDIDMSSPEMFAKEKAYLEYLSKAF